MPSVNKWKEKVLQIVEEEGLTCAEVGSTGGTHLKFTLEHKGVKRNLITSRSVSDWRAAENVRRDIKRIKREIDERGGQ